MSKYAYGYCDRSGWRYPINELVEEFENGVPTGRFVGKDMVDPDHPQLKLGRVNANDRQSLENPRPEGSLRESRALSSFDPVGGGVTAFGSRTVGLDILVAAGRVEVS